MIEGGMIELLEIPYSERQERQYVGTTQRPGTGKFSNFSNFPK
jgi:hypothetical protein